VSVVIVQRVGLGALCDQLLELVRRVRQLRLDANEYICLKYIILLNSGIQHHRSIILVINNSTILTPLTWDTIFKKFSIICIYNNYITITWNSCHSIRASYYIVHSDVME